MRVIYILCFFAFMIASCANEEFEIIDTLAINKQIKGRTDIKTPKQLVDFIFPDSLKGEYKHKSNTTSSTVGNDQFQVTKIITVNDDDALAAEKYVLIITRDLTGGWTVVSAKKNWKCHEGYCHTDWGI